MYYELYDDNEYQNVLRSFVKWIKEFCCKSEFQFLEKSKLYWEIPNTENFEFRDFYLIDGKVPVFSYQVWEKAMSILDTDGIFQIPVVIKMCGEQHYYIIAVPSRIRCCDSNGRILPKNVGRYHYFKSASADDMSIYVTQKLMTELKAFPTIKFKGVE